MLTRATLTLPLIALALAACDQLGIETPAQVATRIEADGKAVGGACRHAGRALEDCYLLNRRASKAAVYAGWRDMDAYMRENGIAVVAPMGDAEEGTPSPEKKPEPAPTESPGKKAEEAGSGTKQTEIPAGKTTPKSPEKATDKATAKHTTAPLARDPQA